MLTQNLAILLAITGTYASPILKRDECSSACSTAYNTCRGKPDANRSLCASEFASCLGYLPFDSAGSLVTPTACSSTVAPTPTADACVSKCNDDYNTCRTKPNANFSYCASEYSGCLGYVPFNSEGSLVKPTACSTTSTAAPTASPTPTSDACATKCNESYNTCRGKPDANRSTCASEFATCLGYLPFDSAGSLIKPTACSSSTAAPSTTNAPATTAAPVVTQAPVPTQAPAVAGWTVKQLIRYCSADGTGCDYNFDISTNDGAADVHCTIVRTNVGDATTESWYDQPCTTGSAYRISWGYSTQFEIPFAVLTAVNYDAKAQAYFGVNNPNGQEVTPSNPKGSGNFGDIGPQPVYHF